MKKQASEGAVIICTAKRGVFFGYPAGSTDGNTVKLKRCRMVVYWSADVKGIIGLAATGPTKSCRITAAAPSSLLHEVTAVVDCSDDAVKAFEAGPWA